MIVDQELIKRYHQNRCTPQEAAAVEDWLFTESLEEKLVLPTGEDKLEHKAVMWTAISAQLNTPSVKEEKVETNRNSVYALPLSIAASILLLAVGAYVYSTKPFNPDKAMVEYYAEVGDIEFNGVHIFLGDKSKASINTSSSTDQGTVNFCGMILINPEQDIKLTLHAQCISPTDDSKIQNLKKGERYIAFNYKFNTTQEVMIVNEKNLLDLPPVLQREIMKQFHI